MNVETLNIPEWSDFRAFIPEAVMFGAFLLALIGDIAAKRRPVVPFVIVLFAGVTALAYAVAGLDPQGASSILGPMVVVDGLSSFFRVLFALTAVITVLFSWASEEIMGAQREHKGEFYALLALMTGGMMVMAESRDMVMLYLSLELVSLTSYVMAGYMRGSLRATEASLKYMIFGAMSSGIMLFGLSLLYALTGSLTFEGVREALAAGQADPLALLTVCVLILAGLGYKVAMVPFHFWAPDVYEGAPTPVAAFFSVGPKAAGFALLIRFFYTAFQPVVDRMDWPMLIAVLSVATMTWGNLAAVKQTNVKRLLAYSSVAHVGYLLMAFLMLTDQGLQAILFYLLVYTLMNLGAFLFVVTVNNSLKSEDLADYAGLGFRAPWAAAAMVVFLFALTGLPPTAGFIGKFYIFAEVMRREWYWLAIVGVLNSVVSLYYYMKIARAMYFDKAPDDAPAVRVPALHLVCLALLALPTLLLGVRWDWAKDLADRAVTVIAGL
ncbi:NADH-quinone oxidoreductase subunit N [bacterium]|nr:NADH-quinone oxidoreductase subunit N [bacterium]HPF36714.1 NADH-quinone oxidoreductase subunit N [Candidatus Krumholzibacteria bacterium]HRX52553.1 NADH-quinone oxidoreductase subunit N [Candidatus Krumholzibacteria bacterium]